MKPQNSRISRRTLDFMIISSIFMFISVVLGGLMYIDRLHNYTYLDYKVTQNNKFLGYTYNDRIPESGCVRVFNLNHEQINRVCGPFQVKKRDYNERK